MRKRIRRERNQQNQQHAERTVHLRYDAHRPLYNELKKTPGKRNQHEKTYQFNPEYGTGIVYQRIYRMRPHKKIHEQYNGEKAETQVVSLAFPVEVQKQMVNTEEQIEKDKCQRHGFGIKINDLFVFITQNTDCSDTVRVAERRVAYYPETENILARTKNPRIEGKETSRMPSIRERPRRTKVQLPVYDAAVDKHLQFPPMLPDDAVNTAVFYSGAPT
jgi:hypothetical protein